MQPNFFTFGAVWPLPETTSQSASPAPVKPASQPASPAPVKVASPREASTAPVKPASQSSPSEGSQPQWGQPAPVKPTEPVEQPSTIKDNYGFLYTHWTHVNMFCITLLIITLFVTLTLWINVYSTVHFGKV